jgi:hypothetical protein
MTRQIAVGIRRRSGRTDCPGTVDSPFVEGYWKYHKHEKEKVRAELNQRQPIGSWETGGDCQSGALFVLSGSGFCDRIGDRHRRRLTAA